MRANNQRLKDVALGAGGALVLGLFGWWLYRRGQRSLADVPQASWDYLPGGKGDWRPDNVFDPVEVARGVKVEMEHTSNPDIAKEIAKDHLTEDPAYYLKLKTIHLDGLKSYYRDERDETDT